VLYAFLEERRATFSRMSTLNGVGETYIDPRFYSKSVALHSLSTLYRVYVSTLFKILPLYCRSLCKSFVRVYLCLSDFEEHKLHENLVKYPLIVCVMLCMAGIRLTALPGW
jgi:hypothetical protein